MQKFFTKNEILQISYGQKTVSVSKYAIFGIIAAIFAILVYATLAFANIAQSTHELEKLRQQLTIERTVNASLAKEIQKSNEGIEKLMHNLTGTPKKKSTLYYQENIASPIQLYGILNNIQKNLLIIDSTLNTKISKLRSVMNIARTIGGRQAFNGLSKINLAYSSHINEQQSVQKASKHFPTPTIDISQTVENITLKSAGLAMISQSLKNLPVEMPMKGARFMSGFGARFHPIHHRTRMHNGLDFAGPSGSKIKATGSGVIMKAVYSPSFGNYVVIQHKNRIQTLYAHMSAIKVRQGQRVQTGQVIGIQGSTGHSTGAHVHYEIIVGGQHYNPMSFIQAKSILQKI